MVRRLVEEEQVRRDEQELRQRHAGPLAAGEDADLLLDVVAREEERAGDAADVGLALVGHEVPERVEDGALGVERAGAAAARRARVPSCSARLEVVLGVVAGDDAVAELHLARVGRSSPATSLSSVVFPAPFGPITPTRSPRCTAASSRR